jgi:hypothetical protein
VVQVLLGPPLPPLLERTQWLFAHWVLSAHGSPMPPLVQKLSNEPFAQEPTSHGALSAQGSPTAPEVHLPPKLPIAQVSPVAHWSAEEHVLPTLPSVQVPSVEVVYDLLQCRDLQSLALSQVEPIAPSLQVPSELALSPVQMLLVQSVVIAHAALAAPSLQRPTNEVVGKTHLRPLSQSLASLHVAPRSPPWQVRDPSSDVATQLPARQSPSFRQVEPLAPVTQSPGVPWPACLHRPVPQSPSDVHGEKSPIQRTTSPKSHSQATVQFTAVAQPRF